jgi:plasmid stabilization system protein ParE
VSRAVSFRPQAESELLEVRAWYESRREGLGQEFGAAVEHAVDRIAESPLTLPIVRGETRRAILRRFPYAIYFRMLDSDIVVLAVHGPQHERRWQSRL